MIQTKTLPDREKFQRCAEKLRKSNIQMELFTLALDELIAMVEADIRKQRLQRLQDKSS